MSRLRLATPLLASILLAACASDGTGIAATPPAAPAAPASPTSDELAAERIKPFQYLYGSAEASAIAIGAYHALVEYARTRVASRPADSVVLAPAATLDTPSFAPCGDKPLAAVFDVDETMVLNLGFEARAAEGEAYDEERWQRWEATGADAVSAVPGATYAVNTLRDMGVTVIFNTNRTAAEAAGTVKAIAAAGLGEAVHGETLFLKGDDATGSAKDTRRAVIAAKYCVIAMAGDQLGDFSDLFNRRGLTPTDRRAAASHGWAARMWTNGWFVLPNPVYGPSLRGDVDDIFPADKRWDDPKDSN